MKFEDAFDKAVKAFYQGKTASEYEKTKVKPSKFNHDYFDELYEIVKPVTKKKK